MKVKEIDPGTLSVIQGKKGKPKEVSGSDFKKLLQEAHSSLNQVDPAVSSNPTFKGGEISADPLQSVTPAGFIPGLRGLTSLQREGAQATERILDTLEKYQEAMVNPQISLKEISPLVQSLSREVKELTQRSEKLSSSDPLQKIMAEIGILSSVEIEKFNRGDYI